MPSSSGARKLLASFILFFGISGAYIDGSQAEETAASPQPDDGLWVEVEPTNLLPSDITGIYYLVPYRSRRANSGHLVSLGYSSYKPSNYTPNFIASDFSNIYPSAEVPLVELQYIYKRNFSFGSIGIDSGVGMYNNSSDDTAISSELQLIPVRLGGVFYLDSLFFEPYVVPYIAGGIYTVFYEETLEGSSAFGGNTQIAPYMTVGLSFQLNWVDREAARISYLDSGVENTFIYIEGRSFYQSQAAQDPDLSTGFDWGAGVRVEF